MTNRNDGIYEGPEENNDCTGGLVAQDERNEVEQTRLRVVVLRDFVANAALSDEERSAYCRRFCTLFVDESSMRKGGVGTVYRVENAFGEQFALKILHSGQKTMAPPQPRPTNGPSKRNTAAIKSSKAPKASQSSTERAPSMATLPWSWNGFQG